MLGAGHAGRPCYRATQQGVVATRNGPPRARPLVEMLQLDAQDGGLHLVHAVVPAGFRPAARGGRSPTAQAAGGARLLGIVGDDDAALSRGAQVLGGVEAEAPRVADAAGAPPLVACAMRLRRVLHDGEPVAARQLQDWIHGGRLPVQVDRDDGARATADRRLQGGRVHRERAGVHVDQPHVRAGAPNGIDRGHEGEGYGDHPRRRRRSRRPPARRTGRSSRS